MAVSGHTASAPGPAAWLPRVLVWLPLRLLWCDPTQLHPAPQPHPQCLSTQHEAPWPVHTQPEGKRIHTRLLPFWFDPVYKSSISSALWEFFFLKTNDLMNLCFIHTPAVGGHAEWDQHRSPYPHQLHRRHAFPVQEGSGLVSEDSFTSHFLVWAAQQPAGRTIVCLFFK